MYVVRFSDDYYLEQRGGYDWGRVPTPAYATKFDTFEEAARWAGLSSGLVYEWDGVTVSPVNDGRR
jgi:hypothetical protein